jgi:protein-disulfide isomerase
VSKAILAVLSIALLGGAACEKKPAKAGDTGAINAMDRAGSDEGDGPVDTTPLDGVDVSKLSKDKQAVFYKLVGSLTSPCGKAHSLRTSYVSDTSCKRAPFAVRYVVEMLTDEGNEAQVREAFDKKYKGEGQPVKIDVSKAATVGPNDAPIRLVEFFDYECPHCQLFKPVLEQVLAERQGKVVLHYMMFPLEKHHDSKSAAQAAVAANQLGKFHEMHDLLFAKAPAHTHDDVTGYAKEIGLDAGKFEAAYNAAGAQVAADLAQGEAAGVDSTPTLYFNDRKYEGPMHPKYIEMWIDEELAVNR